MGIGCWRCCCSGNFIQLSNTMKHFYWFAILLALTSYLLAFRIIYVNSVDFFNPNSIAFQMLNLPRSTILTIDILFIALHLIAITFMSISLFRRNLKMIVILSVSVWFLFFVQHFIESRFRFVV